MIIACNITHDSLRVNSVAMTTHDACYSVQVCQHRLVTESSNEWLEQTAAITVVERISNHKTV